MDDITKGLAREKARQEEEGDVVTDRTEEVAVELAKALYLQTCAPDSVTLDRMHDIIEATGLKKREELEAMPLAEIVGTWAAFVAMHAARGIMTTIRQLREKP